MRTSGTADSLRINSPDNSDGSTTLRIHSKPRPADDDPTGEDEREQNETFEEQALGGIVAVSLAEPPRQSARRSKNS